MPVLVENCHDDKAVVCHSITNRVWESVCRNLALDDLVMLVAKNR